MANLVIKGHATRGKEVIELLEMLGGKNKNGWDCKNPQLAYYIDDTGLVEFIINTCNPNENILRYTIEDFLKKFPYKVGDRVLLKGVVKTIKQVCWDNTENEVIYKLETNIRGFSEEYYVHHYDLQPCKEETMENKNNLLQQLQDYFNNTPRDVLEKEWHEYDKYNEIGPTVNEYLEYVNKSRQPQYPKTYEECCEVLGLNSMNNDVQGYRADLIICFQKLFIARNAYWEIAGEQMGLGKHWEPDFTNDDEERYGIYTAANKVKKDFCGVGDVNVILTFPTEEMRDAFFENFKDLIEQCKELL